MSVRVTAADSSAGSSAGSASSAGAGSSAGAVSVCAGSVCAARSLRRSRSGLPAHHGRQQRAMESDSFFMVRFSFIIISIQKAPPSREEPETALCAACTQGAPCPFPEAPGQRRRSLRPCLTYVTRSPGSASSYRSPFPPFGSGTGSFVRITVTGLARASHPVPTAAARRRFRAETYGIEFPTFYPLLCELSTDFPHLRGFGCMIFP